MKVLKSQSQPKIYECEKGSFREEGMMAGVKGIAEYRGVESTRIHYIHV